MNTAIVMLGSNEQPEFCLETAKEKLSEYFEIISISSIVTSKPHGKQYQSNFQNQAIIILSDETAEETKSVFKEIEIQMGRKKDSKEKGIILIDIDLIIWNDNIIHKDYHRLPFIKNCIGEIYGQSNS